MSKISPRSKTLTLTIFKCKHLILWPILPNRLFYPICRQDLPLIMLRARSYQVRRVSYDDLPCRSHNSTFETPITLLQNSYQFLNRREMVGLYKRYGGPEFEIVAVPCNQFFNQEPGTSEGRSACQHRTPSQRVDDHESIEIYCVGDLRCHQRSILLNKETVNGLSQAQSTLSSAL